MTSKIYRLTLDLYVDVLRKSLEESVKEFEVLQKNDKYFFPNKIQGIPDAWVKLMEPLYKAGYEEVVI